MSASSKIPVDLATLVAKATTTKKGKKLPKSKAIVEDSSDDEPPALVAIEEDTVMGNADTPCTILDTDTVSISFLAAIARTADEVIARLQQMSIDDEVEIVVNKDPSLGNIVEGCKVLPKFKKNKVKEDATGLDFWGKPGRLNVEARLDEHEFSVTKARSATPRVGKSGLRALEDRGVCGDPLRMSRSFREGEGVIVRLDPIPDGCSPFVDGEGGTGGAEGLNCQEGCWGRGLRMIYSAKFLSSSSPGSAGSGRFGQKGMSPALECSDPGTGSAMSTDPD
ncbi:uncharacterized protein EV420DRAFT_1486614 [Desarmillaria tabescens]|uniref:Uncharacterized protein n=1 Tax=Armillaria tabescens TaxID=1929756 RepID=A0AA39J9J8_ARMTA|nr:uncharacterized protein EV420DRAFT_1486614 [Desarmillaria tabescens]KAK0438681.1 hypothetical protein EV420DRAFT_1486614 [Desarmillaria tabescens]